MPNQIFASYFRKDADYINKNRAPFVKEALNIIVFLNKVLNVGYHA